MPGEKGGGGKGGLGGGGEPYIYKLLMKQLSSNHSHVHCYTVVSAHQMFVFVVVLGDNVQQAFTEHLSTWAL